MKAALYIRVSTEEQAKEGYSISAQKQKLKAYCIAQDWEVAGVYVDEGLSAKDMNRPQLELMMKDIQNGKVDCVLVYRLDRLTRSVLDLYKLLETFEKYDCKFKSATEVFETTTALGRMFITIVAAMAQWERENLAERIRFGLTEKARQGKWAVNLAPFGYDIEGDYLVINKEEARTVQYIYDEYLSGKGMNTISIDLNKKGISTKTDSTWHATKLQYILKNPAYIGTMRWNYRVNKENYFEVENAIPPIISKDQFEQVQKVMEARSVSHPRAATSEFIFSGVVKCARCGSPLTGKYGYSKRGEKIHRPRGYVCTKSVQKMCDLRQVSEKYLEHHFLELISKWDIRADEVPETKSQPSTQEDDRESIIKSLEAIEKRKKKWQYGWANDMLSDDDFRARMQEEAQKEKPLREQLELLQEDTIIQVVDEEEILSVLSDLRLNWNYLTALEKKNFLALIVERIDVDKIGPNGKIESVKITDIQLRE
ncbi:recombinase family protein [Mesobacillus subterraneus]|uniref:recombinase family protein n=1 Tax=Mesobacillus subterraneus TaxID=285983 RepID=UPI00203CF2B2|nr:recombinase family protein [Mesobacillus subterraneus]MCM3665553.1 recombinase family protein [Mesobacillus subterraneus]MCM3686112.1 recombinase family protein [Mesobacillus subterraneus]